MGNRYSITGVQLAMLAHSPKEEVRKKLMEDIIEKQQLKPRISLKLNSSMFDDLGRIR